ncbi:MAG: hypothetical protein PVH17_05625 [Anaerolineae bacterium]|jgi:hypothetical protein
MEDRPLYIEGKILCEGLKRSMSRSEEPALCLIKSDTIEFIAVSGVRLIISWKTKLAQPAPRNLVLVFPPLVAGLLACDAVCSQVGVELILHGNNGIARLTDHMGKYDLRWKSDLSSFPAPNVFGQMIQVPEALVDVPHIKFSDATHQAVAKLVHMEADDEINRNKLAILIDLNFGRLTVEGEEIVATESHRYYFDPRLVIRALEFFREKTLRVGITPLLGGRRGYLSLLAEQDEWLVHTSLLSIGRDTQRLYPLPQGGKVPS